ncbi:hypothetical protein [Verrucosispora sp. WMMD573]|uniref:hypothetical protein n=1 Tax=Verrucosispora sp. WMMD573 TaxID=3015149 RepID=UPI00248C1D75|nr:hypothetical protein [Verrucosispora sp. WMMD573]WBB54344.1 hypothetical protein O7601_28125 [Verrucosispora sp. WMMD573]
MTKAGRIVNDDFPVEDFLIMLGSPISRLLLIERFSKGDASIYSDGRFTPEVYESLASIAFARDPISGDFYARPELEPLLLATLVRVYPSAAPELAERLITRQIGHEVLDSTDFISWMIRHRWHPLACASVAAAAAFAPHEVDGIIYGLRRGDHGTDRANLALTSYATAAQRWAAALEPPRNKTGYTYFTLNALINFERLPIERRFSPPRTPKFSETDGFVPLAIQQGPKRSGARNTTTLVTQPQTAGYVLNQRNPLARPALPNGWSEAPRDYQVPIFGLPEIALSESTLQLLQLVIAERGPSQVNERLELDVDSQLVHREAAIAISDTAASDHVLFVYLGSLPSSIADALPITVTSLAGDRLIPGGGPIISRYRAEMATALAQVTDHAIGTGAGGIVISASDWSRIDRSIREPWRFVSTSREYVDVSMVEVKWTEPLGPHTTSRELWPFNGASRGIVPIEGFRNGSDDSYSVKISLSDMRSLKVLELDSIPRPSSLPALTRPSRIRAYVQWSTAAYLSLFTFVTVCAAALIALSLTVATGGVSSFDYSTLSLIVSLTSVTTSPFIAYLATVGNRKESGLLRYRSALVRAAAVAGITLLSSAASLLSDSHYVAEYAAATVNLIVGGYLVLSAGLSIALRLRLRPRIDRFYHHQQTI